MGTHPIFESDFDCLTECYNGQIMNIGSNPGWPKTGSSVNGFFGKRASPESEDGPEKRSRLDPNAQEFVPRWGKLPEASFPEKINSLSADFSIPPPPLPMDPTKFPGLFPPGFAVPPPSGVPPPSLPPPPTSFGQFAPFSQSITVPPPPFATFPNPNLPFTKNLPLPQVDPNLGLIGQPSENVPVEDINSQNLFESEKEEDEKREEEENEGQEEDRQDV